MSTFRKLGTFAGKLYLRTCDGYIHIWKFRKSHTLLDSLKLFLLIIPLYQDLLELYEVKAFLECRDFIAYSQNNQPTSETTLLHQLHSKYQMKQLIWWRYSDVSD